jgi:hypothetical protein
MNVTRVVGERRRRGKREDDNERRHDKDKYQTP